MPEPRVMIKDSDWRIIEGEACRVLEFLPMAEIRGGKIYSKRKTTPYASVRFECIKFQQSVEGYISHKLDFMNLQATFTAKSQMENVEVLMFWNKKLLNGYAKVFSRFMPRLCIMLCPKQAFEMLTDKNFRPEMQGEAWFLAVRPMMEWKPNVMA